jgi:hypothetical protein
MKQIPNDNPTPNSTSLSLQWVLQKLLDRSKQSGVGLIVICSLIILGLPIISLLAWLGLGLGIYSVFFRAE